MKEARDVEDVKEARCEDMKDVKEARYIRM